MGFSVNLRRSEKQEEAKRLKKALKQVEEGELLVENHHLSVQYEDNASIRKNRSRFYKWRIITIQRAWRAYKRRKELGKRRDLSDDLLATDDLFAPYGPVPTSDPSDTDSLAAMSVGSNTDLSKDDGIESEGESLPTSVEDFPEAEQEKISPGSDIIPDYEDGEEEEEEEYFRLYQNSPPPIGTVNSLSFAEELNQLNQLSSTDHASETQQNKNQAWTRSTETNNRQNDAGQPDSDSNMDESPDAAGSFDVYNVEASLPTLDWASLEAHLEKVTKEAEDRETDPATAQRNSREEIRRKLAMGPFEDSDSSSSSELFPRGKPPLSTRLQTGMNLQICFVNEPNSDSSGHDEDKAEQESRPAGKGSERTAGSVRDSHVSKVLAMAERFNRKKKEDAQMAALRSGEAEDDTDFLTKEAELKKEAQLALAMAKPMAQMQMEVEKQNRKKSPVADVVAATPSMAVISENLKRRKLKRRDLMNMSTGQLQVIVNDLHCEIESLNEELVQALMARDELQMEQDSMLVDIEDLTRQAHAQHEQQQKGSPKPAN
ncbi:IQCJ-SCHIP1 readthrough transcript protein-like isoform X4 [Branchiostoma lanceolatum]|uniref:IQCJ-SCHIP1 readthrough transcript protein-like isoform X4 n=1 Tax=Branchiostoma lanceolatum TaxID=7740 RepID=UPI00345190E5